MTSNGDLIQTTWFGSILGQRWNMVQSYIVEDLGGGPLPDQYFLGLLESLYNGIRGHWSSYIIGSMSNQMTLSGVRGANLYSETAFGEYYDPTPLAGSISTDPMPPFVAVRLRSPSKRKGMRASSKFLPGIVESLITGGSVITAANVAAFQNFADEFGSQQFVAPGSSFTLNLTPVCVQRIFEGVVNGKRRYRMPTNAGETVTYLTDSYVALNTVTTMNSRKLGRGV